MIFSTLSCRLVDNKLLKPISYNYSSINPNNIKLKASLSFIFIERDLCLEDLLVHFYFPFYVFLQYCDIFDA